MATTLAEGCYIDMFFGCTGIKLSESGSGTVWSIPAGATTATNWNNRMFEGTGGTFTGAPTVGTMYYYTASTSTHTHVYSTDFTFDETNHWNECSCGDKNNITAHATSGKCACGGLVINDTEFKDDNFRAYLMGLTSGADGFFTKEELAAITEINVFDKGITTLDGIEYFTALKTLNCDKNALQSLDLSANTSLQLLSCYDNSSMTSLNVSGCVALEVLYCYRNNLSSLDVSELTLLRILTCSQNALTELDVRNNTALEELACHNNALTQLDVSKNTELTKLKCYNNKLTELDVSHNTKLTLLTCQENQLTKLDVSMLPLLKDFSCHYNHLTSLDVSTQGTFSSSFFDYQEATITIDQRTMTFDMATIDENFDGAKATVTTEGCYFNGTVLTVKENAKTVTYTYDTGSSTKMSVTLTISNPHTHDYSVNHTCSCGLHSHDSGVTVFLPWTNAAALPSNNLSGSYYLTDDVTISNQWRVVNGAKINICLGGHTIDLGTSGYLATNGHSSNASMRGTLSIYDCDGDGVITGSKGVSTGLIHNKNVVNIYGGTIINTNTSAPAIVTDGSSSTVCAVVTIDGGDIVGGTYGIYAGAYSNIFVLSGSVTGNTNDGIYSQSQSSSERNEVHIYGGSVIGRGNDNQGLYLSNVDVYLSGAPSIKATTERERYGDIAYNYVIYAYKKGDTASVYIGDTIYLDRNTGASNRTGVLVYGSADTDKFKLSTMVSGTLLQPNGANLEFHTHVWDYQVSPDSTTLTATCSPADETTCQLTDTTVKIIAPTLTVYGGEGSAGATLSSETFIGTSLNTSSIKYKKDGGSYSSTVPTAAGNYTARISVKSNYIYVTYTIEKANQTEPMGVGKADTTYIDTIDGKLTGVTADMEYKLSTASAWSPIGGTTVTKLASGTYYIRVAETDNYKASNYVTVTIDKGPKRTAALDFDSGLTLDKAYDNMAAFISSEDYSYIGDGEITVTWYADNNGVKGEALTSAPINSGTYWVGIKAVEGDSYFEAAEITKQFTISQQKVSKPAENTTKYIYSGKEQTYVIAENELYSIENNKRTDAGSQSVTVSLKDKNNYEWADGTVEDIIFTFTINIAHTIIIVDTTPIIVEYGQIWSLPVAKSNFGEAACSIYPEDMVNVGSYTVVYLISDTENYYGSSESISVTVTKKAITKPEQDNTAYTYNGEEQTYKVAENSAYTVFGNKRITAGSCDVTVSLKDKVNYEWSDGTTDDIVFKFTVNKLVAEKPTQDDTVYIYNGEEQTYKVAENSAYTVFGSKRTEVGSQTVTVYLKDKLNIEWTDGTTDNVSFTFTVNKAKTVITVDESDIVKTYGEAWSLPTATSNVGTVVCDKVVAEMVNAGTYTVTYSVAETYNYTGAEKTITVIINKATFDTAFVTFADSTVKYSGEVHRLEIVGTLPEGVSVEYTNNGKSDAGVYTVTASFVYNANNYNPIEPMTAVLTINQDKIVDYIGEETNAPDIEVSSENGITPGFEIVITEVDGESTKDSELVGAFDNIGGVYDVTMMSDGAEVQLSGELTIKLLIPENLIGKNFRILHNHDGDFTEIEYTVEGEYAVFTVDKLSEFSFVYYQFPAWIVITVVAVIAAAACFAIYWFVIRKKEKAA